MSDSLWPRERTLATGSSVHGVSQVRTLEWVAIPFSRGSPRPRDRIQVSCIAGSFFFFFFFLPSETPGKPKDLRVSGAILWKATHFAYLYNLWFLCILVISSSLSFTLWLKVLFISKIKANPFPVGVNKAVHSSILGLCTQSAKGKEKRKDVGLGARLQAAEHAWLQALDSSVTGVSVPEMTATEPRTTATDTPCFL